MYVYIYYYICVSNLVDCKFRNDRRISFIGSFLNSILLLDCSSNEFICIFMANQSKRTVPKIIDYDSSGVKSRHPINAYNILRAIFRGRNTNRIMGYTLKNT